MHLRRRTPGSGPEPDLVSSLSGCSMGLSASADQQMGTDVSTRRGSHLSLSRTVGLLTTTVYWEWMSQSRESYSRRLSTWT
jgi:hypothetical protein